MAKQTTHIFKVWHVMYRPNLKFKNKEFNFKDAISRTEARTIVENLLHYAIAPAEGKKRGPKATTMRRQKINKSF